MGDPKLYVMTGALNAAARSISLVTVGLSVKGLEGTEAVVKGTDRLRQFFFLLSMFFLLS